MKCAILLLALTCGVLSAPVENEAIDEFKHGNHKFSHAVYKEMRKYERGSFVACPISAETVLALTHEGARGDTFSELVTGLYLPNTIQKTQYAFKSFLPSLQRSDENLKFYSANKIYAGAHVKLENNFEDIARSVYYSDIANIDFSENNQAAGVINKWVEEQTNNKIHDLVNPMSLNEDTKLVLVNSLYFSGTWANQFHVIRTMSKPFHVSEDATVEVPTMSQTAHLNYYDHPTLNAEFLELPYTGGNISMVIILPHEGYELSQLEEHTEHLWEPQPFKKQKVAVELPKFKTETEIKFVPILQNMGIKKAFKAGADFSGISLSNKDLHISDVLQKAYISIDEKGTEATAATVVTVVGMDAGPVVNFNANRPFLYYITYNGIVTFFGRVSDFR